MNIQQIEIITVFPENPSEEIIRMYVSVAAYYKAEKRGFVPGHAEQDWLEAEKEIRSCLNNYFDNFYYQ